MSRIRTIKPEFFLSPTIAQLDFRARLTFIGLWTYVDDEGRCRLEPKVIAGQLWPLDDDVTGADVEKDIDDMAFMNLVTVYAVAGKRYLAVNGWREHQRINRPTTSKFPPPVDESSVSEEFSTGISTAFSTGEDSVSAHGRKGKEGEREVEGEGELEPGEIPVRST